MMWIMWALLGCGTTYEPIAPEVPGMDPSRSCAPTWHEVESPFADRRCFERTVIKRNSWGDASTESAWGGIICLPTVEIQLKPCAELEELSSTEEIHERSTGTP